MTAEREELAAWIDGEIARATDVTGRYMAGTPFHEEWKGREDRLTRIASILRAEKAEAAPPRKLVKRPTAFIVRTESGTFLEPDEDKAREIADAFKVEYGGLYERSTTQPVTASGDGLVERLRDTSNDHARSVPKPSAEANAMTIDNGTINAMADAIDAARYAHPQHPRERDRTFDAADRSDREYAFRLARAAFNAHAKLNPEKTEAAPRVGVKPLEWREDHGVAGFGPYRLFQAETPIGSFAYGTDSEGACYWHGAKFGVSMVGDEATAKRQAEASWEKLARQEVSKFLSALEALSLPSRETQEPVAEESAPQMLARLRDNAALWAAEFRKTALRLGYSDMDEGWLIGWFASAIENAEVVRHPQVIASPPSPAAPLQTDGWKIDPQTVEACIKALHDSADPDEDGFVLGGPSYILRRAVVAIRSLSTQGGAQG